MGIVVAINKLLGRVKFHFSKPIFVFDSSVIIDALREPSYKQSGVLVDDVEEEAPRTRYEIARDALAHATRVGKLVITDVTIMELHMPEEKKVEEKCKAKCPQCDYEFHTVICPLFGHKFNHTRKLTQSRDRSDDSIRRDLNRLEKMVHAYSGEVVCIPKEAHKIATYYILREFRSELGHSIPDALIISYGIIMKAYVITRDDHQISVARKIRKRNRFCSFDVISPVDLIKRF